MKKFLIVICSLSVILVGSILIQGSQIPDMEPLAYHPEPAPEMTGPLTPNNELKNARRLLDGVVKGPEDIILDDEGNLYVANSDGRIIKHTTENKLVTLLRSDGRPLGMRFDSRGNLIVCHTTLGLISITPAGKMTVLVPNGEQFHLIDDLEISSDDKVYFSDASSLEGLESFYYDILLHRPLGSVWCYDLNTGDLTLVMDSLYFANGIALTENEQALLVNETAIYSIRKIWLSGPRKGESEILVDNLPGFPDGIDPAGPGQYWVSMASPRKGDVDKVYHPRPWLKKILMYLPQWLRPGPKKYGLVILIDSEGNILRSLHDMNGKVLWSVTNVYQRGNDLYLGSLFNDAVGKYRLSD